MMSAYDYQLNSSRSSMYVVAKKGTNLEGKPGHFFKLPLLPKLNSPLNINRKLSLRPEINETVCVLSLCREKFINYSQKI